MEIMVSNNKEIIKYHSRIEEITADRMMLAMPMSKGYPVLLRPGDIFEGKIIVKGNVYCFTSAFVDKKIVPLPVWIVSAPYDIKKVQLREFVRIDTILSVQVQSLSSEQQEISLNLQTRDISGGGVQLVGKQPINIGVRLALTLAVPDAGSVQANGEVVRLEQPDLERPLFWIGVKFLEIAEKDRSKLIKFIFKKQLERRKKEL
ncbi:flagellar protein ycgr [Lucifera butyrica]|uniref:Flagellar protein ycgr n=1 Tax=Lucifera butyrica TaxID=1351585 RepID=A0A498RAR5_9FIRM|nr:flagellar protein ycgr [Lucifera butyrica]